MKQCFQEKQSGWLVARSWHSIGFTEHYILVGVKNFFCFPGKPRAANLIGSNSQQKLNLQKIWVKDSFHCFR